MNVNLFCSALEHLKEAVVLRKEKEVTANAHFERWATRCGVEYEVGEFCSGSRQFSLGYRCRSVCLLSGIEFPLLWRVRVDYHLVQRMGWCCCRLLRFLKEEAIAISLWHCSVRYTQQPPS